MKCTVLSQTKADSDELKSDCMNCDSSHADRAAARESRIQSLKERVQERTVVSHWQFPTIQNVEKTVKVAQAQYTASAAGDDTAKTLTCSPVVTTHNECRCESRRRDDYAQGREPTHQ